MKQVKLAAAELIAEPTTRRGVVVEITEQGAIRVQDLTHTSHIVECDVLRASTSAPPNYQKDDAVLYVIPEGSERGCVLGIVELQSGGVPKALASTIKKSSRLPSTTTVQDEVVHIKAHKGLVIECGEGTIIITQDGKLQIKGKEIASRARGMHKIKGAAINLN